MPATTPTQNGVINGIPREQFCNTILPLALEGDIKWEVSNEIEDDLSITELADPRHVTDVEVKDNRITIFSELQKTVSERVARATHWQPAEYRNHDVTVIVEVTLWLAEDPEAYVLPETDVLVHQREYPTEPPAPDV